jgi:5-methylcytosine-specific restriction endonuclease McrA
MAQGSSRHSEWLRLRNGRRIERLAATMPDRFPQAVWRHAIAHGLVPEIPSKAVQAYWQAHPLRADRLARALAEKSGSPPGWNWRLDRPEGRRDRFRTPPLPYREAAFALPKGSCCVCGQPVYRFGWHTDFWGDATSNRRSSWHAACVVAWRFWNAPSEHDRILKRIQRHRCAETQRRLLRDAQVDHRIPLFRVWRNERDAPWPRLLSFWGMPNLQVINRHVHVRKSADEARERAGLRDIAIGNARASTRACGAGGEP